MALAQSGGCKIMPENAPTQTADNVCTATQSISDSTQSRFWLFVWLGTSLAGTLFGLLLGLTGFANEGFGAAIFGAVLGLIVGFFYAGIVAGPVVLLTATAYWALGTRRWRVFLAIIAGGATGTLSSLPITNADEILFPLAATGVAVILAALLGSVGAWIAAVAWTRRVGQMRHTTGERVGDAEMPITNRYFRVGVLIIVVAIFVSACLGVIFLVGQAREAARRNQCSNNLKQIALCLHNYEAANGALPRAYMTNKDGKPVLSWRVAVARYYFYHTNFGEWMDLDQPWNSPKNARFLAELHAGSFIHCPSSGKKPENPLTDYVAVVGPDTLWPGKVPGDLKRHPKGILVVEWPRSDIHWAEPRDITVEEFLDWFRRKPPRRTFLEWLLAKPAEHGSFHPGCLLYVDAQGNVGELRNDTDPETVRKLLIGQSTVADTSLPMSGAR
jgi:hypothetical protein